MSRRESMSCFNVCIRTFQSQRRCHTSNDMKQNTGIWLVRRKFHLTFVHCEFTALLQRPVRCVWPIIDDYPLYLQEKDEEIRIIPGNGDDAREAPTKIKHLFENIELRYYCRYSSWVWLIIYRYCLNFRMSFIDIK